MIFDKKQLDALVAKLLETIAADEKGLDKKLALKTLDPFIFAIEFAELGTHSWKSSARIQASRKLRESKIGDFHENLFGLIPGWKVMPRESAEPDLVCEGRKLIVEMKSRSDTVKGSNLKDVYDDLLNNVNGLYRGYKGIYGFWLNSRKKSAVAISPFTPPDNKTKQKRPADPRIWQADGRILWALVLDPTAPLEGPYKNPDVIFDVYSEVFDAFDRVSKTGLTDKAKLELQALSKRNFGI